MERAYSKQKTKAQEEGRAPPQPPNTRERLKDRDYTGRRSSRDSRSSRSSRDRKQKKDKKKKKEKEKDKKKKKKKDSSSS